MAEGDQLGGPLGGLDARDPGDTEHVALGRVPGAYGLARLRGNAHRRARNGASFGRGLVAHVDHSRAARLVEVTEPFAHAGAYARCASSINARTASTRPSRISSIGSGSPLTIDSKNCL